MREMAPPQAGDVFEEFREGPFGQPRCYRWHVQHVYAHADGCVYVQLMRADDGTLKTLSHNALMDRDQFRPVA